MKNFVENKFQLRNVQLPELVERLQEWESRKIDVVVPSSMMSMDDTNLSGIVQGKYGFDTQVFEPSKLMHTQIADKLGIPFSYYMKMYAEQAPLLGENVNTWLKSKEKSYLLRGYNNPEGGVTFGRALLSNSYKPMDNLPVLMATLMYIQKNNLNVTVQSADISETKMYVSFIAPDVVTSAKDFLKKYANPNDGSYDDGVVAGFTISNSEVGGGAFQIAGRCVARVCKNGMIGQREAMRKTHLGTRLEEGFWSQDTHEKNFHLVQAQIRDYVKRFTSHEFLQSQVDYLEEKGNTALVYPQNAVINSCKTLGITENDINQVMGYFIKSGDMNRSGLYGAVTFYAHEQKDADKQYEIESNAHLVLADSIDSERTL